MGAAAAIGGLALGGALMGKKATAPAITSQQQSTQGSTQQSSSGPWAGAEAGLHTLYNAANANYLNSPGPQYYPGQTLADQSWATQHALNSGQALGVNATGIQGGAAALDSAQNLANQTAQGGYLNSNPAMRATEEASNFNPMGMAGMGVLDNIGWGKQLGKTQGMGGLGAFGSGGFVGGTQGDNQLASVANGSMLNNNPYVDQMFNQAAGQVGQNFSKNVMPGVASMFAGAGRYGSESMNNSMDNAQQQYGNQINQLASNIYGGNYANERGLQQGAMNQLNNAGLQERQQQLSGLGTLGNLSQGEQGFQMNALNNLTGNQLQAQNLRLNALNQVGSMYSNERGLQSQAMGMAPGLAQADWSDVANLGNVGASRDAYSQAQIDANKARFDYNQNAPRDNLAFLNSIMSGAPQVSNSSGSSYGSSSGTGMTPGNPMAPMQGAMMGGILGGGLYKAFG